APHALLMAKQTHHLLPQWLEHLSGSPKNGLVRAQEVLLPEPEVVRSDRPSLLKPDVQRALKAVIAWLLSIHQSLSWAHPAPYNTLRKRLQGHRMSYGLPVHPDTTPACALYRW